MQILLTGGSGFLGGAILRKLIERGDRVRALVRSTQRAKQQFEAGGAVPAGAIEWLPGDLAQPQTAVDALGGCDAVLHVAALVKRKAPRELFDLVNVTATEMLLKAAWDRGIRAVYTSSFFALGPSDGIEAGRSPDSPPSNAAPHTDYERTKRAADIRLQDLRRAGAPFVTLYPGVLYGPGEVTEANLVVSIIRDHLRGKVPGLPGGGRARWCYGFMDDVATAHLTALDRAQAGVRLAIPGDNKTGGEFFVELQKHTGMAPPKISIPIPAVWAAGALEECVASLARREPKLTRAEALTYAHHWALDGSEGARALGLQPTSLSQGLARTVSWLRKVEPELFDPGRNPHIKKAAR